MKIYTKQEIKDLKLILSTYGYYKKTNKFSENEKHDAIENWCNKYNRTYDAYIYQAGKIIRRIGKNEKLKNTKSTVTKVHNVNNEKTLINVPYKSIKIDSINKILIFEL
jgi:hypothetical protein